MLLHRSWLTKQYYPGSQAHASKNTPTTSAITTIEQRLIKVDGDEEYYKIGKKKYEMTKVEKNDFKWEEREEIITENGNKVKKGRKIKFKM